MKEVCEDDKETTELAAEIQNTPPVFAEHPMKCESVREMVMVDAVDGFDRENTPPKSEETEEKVELTTERTWLAAKSVEVFKTAPVWLKKELLFIVT